MQELLVHEIAKQLAEDEFEKFRVLQDRQFESDFDKVAKNIAPLKDGSMNDI